MLIQQRTDSVFMLTIGDRPQETDCDGFDLACLELGSDVDHGLLVQFQ